MAAILINFDFIFIIKDIENQIPSIMREIALSSVCSLGAF